MNTRGCRRLDAIPRRTFAPSFLHSTPFDTRKVKIPNSCGHKVVAQLATLAQHGLADAAKWSQAPMQKPHATHYGFTTAQFKDYYPFEAGNTVSWTMSQYVLLATFPRAATSRTSTTSRLMAWGIGVEAPSAPGLMTTERTYNMRLQLWLGGLG
jgi:hypothetical protein